MTEPDPRYLITVQVTTRYLPEQSSASQERYAFAYDVSIRNDGQLPAQLLSRHWIITDGNGEAQEVRGPGVVGEQPVIQPGASYDYVSGCPLATTSGAMQGSYRMVGADGETFDAAIPHFALIASAVES